MRRPRSLSASALTLLLSTTFVACASGTGNGTRRSGDPNRLTVEEMERSSQLDLFSVIQQLRPRWLTQRTPMTFAGSTLVAVIIDGIRQNGSAEVLRSLPVTTVQEARYLSAADATTQYGTDMAGGAIVVQTKR
jgi:hypothetical protein